MASSKLLNQIFQGEIASVHNYGAFVKLFGTDKKSGLVHKSQISASRVDDATEILEKNEKVWVKVISVSDDGKLALSMKVVDQGSGNDLDPNGVQISLDEQQRKERPDRSGSRAITLDAVFNTTCTKCGVAGHLGKFCFKAPGSKSYDLIPEPVKEKKIFGSAEDKQKRVADAIGLQPENPVDGMKEKHKKQKSRKRDKSSDDSETGKKKRRKRDEGSDSKKKHKKKKNKKKRKSSSSSE